MNNIIKFLLERPVTSSKQYVSKEVSNFADDTKVFTTINRLNPSSTLQDDINSCTGWAMEWQLPLHISKCKILHLGHSNPMFSYTTHMDGNLLEKYLRRGPWG